IPGAAFGAPVNFFGIVTGSWYFERVAERHGEISLTRVWPAVIAVLTLSGVAAGLSGEIAGIAKGGYTFKAERVQLPDGIYGRLGADGEFLYLKACSGSGKTFAIPASQVTLVAFGERRRGEQGPNLWQVLRGRATLSVGHRVCGGP